MVEIEFKIKQLMEEKARLESCVEENESVILLQFLNKLKAIKETEVKGLLTTIERIDRDIGEITHSIAVKQHSKVCVTESLAQFTPSPEEDHSNVPSINELESLTPPPKRRVVDIYAKLGNLTSPAGPIEESYEAFKLGRLEDNFNDLQETYFDLARHSNDDYLGTFRRGLHQAVSLSCFNELYSFVLNDSPGSNIVSTIEFDTEGRMFATGSVSKVIKIFNYDNLVKGPGDRQFAAQTIHCSAKISNISWNPYIQHNLAAVDYEGVVSVYDVNTCQNVTRLTGHEKRAWSVDHSAVDPTRLASGSDDNTIKIWCLKSNRHVLGLNIKANICSVKFSPASANHVAIGSADHRVHLYDIRNPSKILVSFGGHQKAVSYVRFASADEIISSSTDSTLRLWRLPADHLADPFKPWYEHCSPLRTFTGHSNGRNFVGLSVSEDLVACGSETNTIYAYHRSVTKPIASYKLTPTNPLTGCPVESAAPQFISSVSWKPRSSILATANSQGVVKFLELV